MRHEPDWTAAEAKPRAFERRGIDALRDEALQKVIANATYPAAVPAPSRPLFQRSSTMKLSRIVLLVVAICTGGLAAFIATQRGATPAVAIETVTQLVAEPRTQILVARTVIGVGERLGSKSLEWVDWPQGSIRDDYITIAEAPEAIAEMSGALARFEFFAGEPIRPQKLADPSQGYLSAVLDPGMRGVSVTVDASSASGGFIVPNDRVDVVLTRAAAVGQVSETILAKVRVLAINTRLGEAGETGAPTEPDNPRAEIFADAAIATLELDSEQAEIVINATSLGRLSLVLLPLTEHASSEAKSQPAINQAIRLTSPFWTK